MVALGPPVPTWKVGPSHTLEHLYGERFQRRREEQLDPNTALLFNSIKSKDHVKKHALQRDPARQASFEDERYFLHIPLPLKKRGLCAFSTAECF